MIDRVYTGWDVGGLIKYLFGPGRFNEHVDPRVVASWNHRSHLLQPQKVGPGEFDFDLSDLIAALQAPAKGTRLPVTTPDPNNPKHRRFFKTTDSGELELREGPVWNLVLQTEQADRTLSDEEWRAIVHELLDLAGIASQHDNLGVRWVAVCHDPPNGAPRTNPHAAEGKGQGVHVAMMLVRQDTGRRVWPRRYKQRLREATEAIERKYGLRSSAPADRTAAPADSRGEREKGARQGRVPAKQELRAAVSQAAAASYDLDEFVQALTERGYLVEIRRLPSGDPNGYKVARPGDVDQHGEPIWRSGSRLAGDLSLPALQRRWAQAARGRAAQTRAPGGEQVGPEVWAARAQTTITRCRRMLRDSPDRVDGIAHATGELLQVLDRGDGRLVSGAGARWDRAARAPHRPVPDTGRLAEEMRWLARGLSLTGGSASLELAASLAALALQIAALLQERDRIHQARAARQAARMVTHPPSPGARPRPTAPVASRGPGRGPQRRSDALRENGPGRTWSTQGDRPGRRPPPSRR